MEEKNFDARLADGMTLAYLGDSVMELYVREKLIRSGITRAGELNERAHEIVRAKGQAKAYHTVEGMLTEDELDLFKRGRNSGHLNPPKSATMSEYRTATGFEAVLGYLYLTRQDERIREILFAAYGI